MFSEAEEMEKEYPYSDQERAEGDKPEQEEKKNIFQVSKLTIRTHLCTVCIRSSDYQKLVTEKFCFCSEHSVRSKLPLMLLFSNKFVGHLSFF